MIARVVSMRRRSNARWRGSLAAVALVAASLSVHDELRHALPWLKMFGRDLAFHKHHQGMRIEYFSAAALHTKTRTDYVRIALESRLHSLAHIPQRIQRPPPRHCFIVLSGTS